MDLLVVLLVGRPLNIAGVALVFAVAACIRRLAASGRRALARAALGWACYAAWEWLVVTRTPEANIRVDLVVLWPLLGVVSGWVVYRALRSGRDL